MDGFVINAAQTTPTDGHFAMDNYDAADLPFYYWSATTFAVADRDFAAMASGTHANRNFLLFGHVPPGLGCPVPTSLSRGPRVPLVVVSPWARRNYLSHLPRDHTAIARLIEAVFGLPALTPRTPTVTRSSICSTSPASAT